MNRSFNVSLGGDLRRYVEERTGDKGLYATPSEYIRDLIRRDMQDQSIVQHVLRGLDDAKQGRLSQASILDIADES